MSRLPAGARATRPTDPRRADTAASKLNLETLFELWRISTSLNPDELIRAIVPKLADITNADRVSLMRLDERERVLTVHTAVGLPADVIARARVPLGEPIAGWVAQEGQALLLPGGPSLPRPLRAALSREGIVSALCVPLKSRGGPRGVLNLARLRGRPFTRRHLWFTALLGERLASSVEVARLYDEREADRVLHTSMVESIPLSVVVIDKALRVVSVNRHFLDKTRRDAEHTVGRRVDEVFPPALVQYTRLEEKCAEVFRTHRPVEEGRLVFRAPGVSTRVYVYRIVPLQAAGIEDRAMVLLEDITDREHVEEERRQAERHLASVVECATDVVISFSLDGRILSWNRAAEAVTGFTADEEIGRPIQGVCAAGHGDAMIDLVHRVSRGAKVQHVGIPLRTKEQGDVPIAWSSAPLMAEDNQITGIVAVGRDRTEQLRLEAQLIQSAKMASLGVMASGIAHELRNPLAVVSAAAQLICEQPDDTVLRAEALEKIRLSVARSSSIIEGLLKFAKPVEGRLTMVRMNDLVKDACDLVRDQMALQNVAVQTRLAPDLPRVEADVNLLQQVFVNLMFNAGQAMPEGGTLTILTDVDERGWVVVRFVDTGVGIHPDHLPRVFDPFFTTRPAGQGMGLGLTISYRIIERHKGTIELASGGAGTTAIVSLPPAR